MKKIVALMLTCVMVAASFTGCRNEDTAKEDNDGKIKIVTTIFPIYDWVREVVGESDHTDVKLLLKNGVDLHSYQPTTDDLVAISDADVFIYVGGHSDVWVEDALKNARNKNMEVINLFDVLDDDIKPMTEACTLEEHHHKEGEDHHHEGLDDEHIWVSLKRAERSVEYIAEKLAETDSENSAIYKANGDAYKEKLVRLDEEFQKTVDEASLDTVLFADRFPFFYLTDDYGLHYYAAFSGCSAESEASFETVAFLAGKVDELGIKNVLTIENRNHKIPETIIENTKDKNQAILQLNSLQSVTNKEIEEGLTYLSVMEDNLDTLGIALN